MAVGQLLTVSLDTVDDHQVLQRTSASHTQVDLAGEASDAFELAVLDPDGRPVLTLPVAPRAGRWSVPLELAVGGPYRVEAHGVDNSVTLASHVLVGDLWVLAGQSNMEGCGGEHLEPTSNQVNLLDMARQWRLAEEPLHDTLLAADAVHFYPLPDGEERRELARERVAGGWKGGGLGLAFGRRMVELTGVPVGLLATAHGGTSMTQWNPELVDAGGNSFFGSMMLSIRAAGGRVAGVLWYQGESDVDPAEAAEFSRRLTGLVRAIRTQTRNPDLQFFHVQLSRVVGVADEGVIAGWMRVREIQRRCLDGEINGVAATVDLNLGDPIHLDSASQVRLGRRLARLAAGHPTGPRIREVVAAIPFHWILSVHFDGVSGELLPADHIAGFSIRDIEGRLQDIIVRARVPESAPSTVQLQLARPVGPGDYLWYGHGTNPQCDLVDSEDMAACAFGPWVLLPTEGAPEDDPALD